MNELFNTFSCLVTKDGQVLAADGVHSHAKLAELHEVNEDNCLRYDFGLNRREILPLFDRGLVNVNLRCDVAARRFFDDCVGTPERLIAYVKRGNFHKHLGLLLKGFACGECLKIEDVFRAGYEHWRAVIQADRNAQFAMADADYYQAVGRFGYNIRFASHIAAVYDEAIVDAWNKYDALSAEFSPAQCLADCNQAIAPVWLDLFADPKNRIKIWRN